MTYKENGRYLTVCPRDCFGSCSLDVHVQEDQIIKISPSSVNHNSKGRMCAKGASYTKRLVHPDRILSPLLKNDTTGEFSPVAWEEAFALIADKLRAHKAKDETEKVMYMNSWGQAGVLNNYSQYFWSQYGDITTTYGGLCNDSCNLGVKYTYGNVVKHNNNEDLQNARLIIVWGANPANTNIHRMWHIKKAMEKGAQVIVIDPRKSETMIEGTVKVHPQGGTDGLLAMGIAKSLIEKKLCDQAFIDANVLGFDAYKSHLEAYSIEYILEETGLEQKTLETIVSMIADNPKFALISGTGQSRYSNGGQTERAICILSALTGSIGLSGSGLYFTDNQTPKLKWPQLVQNPFDMKATVHIGMLAQELENRRDKIEFLWIEKANPMTSFPNTNAMKRAFEAIDFIVVLEHFMTDTAKEANLILPAAMFAEKDDLISVYGDSYIHLMQKLIHPHGQCKSEAEIFRLLGQEMGMDLGLLPKVNESFIDDFLAFNKIPTTYKALTDRPYLFEGYNNIAFEDMKFETPSGKIELYSEQMVQWGESPLPTYKPLPQNTDYPLRLVSAHPKERINSQFIEMNLALKQAVPQVEINPVDALERGIEDGQLVRVFNDHGHLILKASVCDDIRLGMVHIFEGWNAASGGCVNKLIDGVTTDIGNGTAYYDSLIDVEKYPNDL